MPERAPNKRPELPEVPALVCSSYSRHTHRKDTRGKRHSLPFILPYSHFSPIVLIAQVSPENVKSPTL